MEESLIPINVVIGDRSYRVRIDRKDEETVRKTVKLINDKLIEFKTNFAGKDMQDYISMVVLWYATSGGLDAGDAGLAGDQAGKLGHLESLLDKVLQK